MSKVVVFPTGTSSTCDNWSDDVLIYGSLEEAKNNLKNRFRDGEFEEEELRSMEVYELGKPLKVKLSINLDIS